MSDILFISDLHLSMRTPGIAGRFFAFLANEARAAGELYILGDLFEAWPGDDAIDDADEPCNGAIVAALRAFSDAGGQLGIMPGNRDFLLGETFARRSGARLLSDPSVVERDGSRLVLAHGDALCAADTDYQAFRQQVRDAAWQADFLARPLAERKALADALRLQSESVKRDKPPQLMDVTTAAAEQLLREQRSEPARLTLIHGHTHRPAEHAHEIDGERVERWVTADWSEARGEYLRWDGKTLTRHALP
ncbi:UDP-2,3-diacylglucosamine diphosphatase [Rhodocyclus tenuis]|uniref:UDP-2,3-diacylglucosamine diphosphatase n=1 Tax=Rhodocyclus tenuis TaxID=1066 RepID=UPI001905558F|nr:UDP-2,3-diacylglucosamine diphosphatase [Rhodocyclus tenuis]MBK1679379.1 UDP-2,3-diacylglucosamine diphosphatase [Rhodocyclus tenuis]